MHTKKRTQEALDRLVLELAETANVSEAARRVGISRYLAYHWYRQSVAGTLSEPSTVNMDDGETVLPLHEAWDSALEVAADHLEAVATRLATGYQEPVVFQGRVSEQIDPDTMHMVPVTITRYSERMLEILLKARRPERFRERHQVEHSGEVKGVLVVPGPVDPDEWKKAAAKHQARGRGEVPGGA